MKCRHCDTLLFNSFLNLGMAPPSNAYIEENEINHYEKKLPLKVSVCHNCWLVQTDDYVSADSLFSSTYAYFSSTSSSWLSHAKSYVEKITDELILNKNSTVVEVASNDGYLLKNFVEKNIPCFGIEPTESTAAVAEKIGIPVIRKFFSSELAYQLVQEKGAVDLIIGNNVYAHVPDINDFTKGLKILLKQNGTITLEFPHILKLLQYCQFDTVYHEHFSYLSLHIVERIFKKFGLRIYKVKELSTHGGSLRIYGCHIDDSRHNDSSVQSIMDKEVDFGLLSMDTYLNFQSRVIKIKDDLLGFINEKLLVGSILAAYGAAAKGNTFINYANITREMIRFVCDAAESKQGKFMPGSHIPILSPSALREIKPDYVIILPWNLKDEIIKEHAYINDWGGKFVVAIPSIKIIN